VAIDLPYGAAAKLGRADQHIHDLNRAVSAYLNQRPFKLVRRFDPEAGKLSLSVKTDIPVPAEISLILGDAIHNLRAVLDFTYFAIISRYTANEKNIQFPIYRPDNKKDVFGRRLVKLAPKEVAAAIEKCQPEPDGQYSIYELDILDVADKHKLLIVASRVADIPGNVFNLVFPEFPVQMVGEGVIAFSVDGDDLMDLIVPPLHPISMGGAFEKDAPIRTSFDLMFANGPFAKSRVIPQIIDLRGKVAEAAAIVWRAANP